MGAISSLDPVKALFGRNLGFCRNEQLSSLELPYVPFDIIIEILSWLPVESLLKFKCVCKRWFLLIVQDNEFIAQQRVRGSYPMLRYYQHEEITGLAAALSDENFTFEAICYGLCLETRVGHPQVARIRNPATRQVLCLPDAHKDTYELSFDLNSSSGECKVVCTYIIEKQNYFGTGVGFEVLTVGKDEQWRPLKNPKQNLPEQGDEGLKLELRFVHQSDEAIHVAAEIILEELDSYLEIYTLDMVNESITCATLPQAFFSDLLCVECFSWDDRLAFAEVRDNVLNVLVLEDYKQQIWSENKIIIPLKFLKDDSHLEDKIILSCIEFNKIRFYNSEGNQCLWYDMETENTEVVELSRDVEKSLASWKPSLVNIKGMKPERERGARTVTTGKTE